VFFNLGSDKKQNLEIRKDILFFLFRNNYWQSRHTPKSNICNKLSQHPCKLINKELKQLYKDEFIRYHVTSHGNDIYLNIRQKSKIELEIKDRLKRLYEWK
jgi:hypothetical protein